MAQPTRDICVWGKKQQNNRKVLALLNVIKYPVLAGSEEAAGSGFGA